MKGEPSCRTISGPWCLRDDHGGRILCLLNHDDLEAIDQGLHLLYELASNSLISSPVAPDRVEEIRTALPKSPYPDAYPSMGIG